MPKRAVRQNSYIIVPFWAVPDPMSGPPPGVRHTHEAASKGLSRENISRILDAPPFLPAF